MKRSRGRKAAGIESRAERLPSLSAPLSNHDCSGDTGHERRPD